MAALEKAAEVLFPIIGEAAARLISKDTLPQQQNAGAKTIIETLKTLREKGKGKPISSKEMISLLDGLTIEKEFTTLRGNLKTMRFHYNRGQ